MALIGAEQATGKPVVLTVKEKVWMDKRFLEKLEVSAIGYGLEIIASKPKTV